jgi:hypothetical protein
MLLYSGLTKLVLKQKEIPILCGYLNLPNSNY